MFFAEIGRASEGNYHKLKQAAGKIYKKAEERPQDVNIDHLKSGRRTNFGILQSPPETYHRELMDWAHNLSTPKVPSPFKKDLLWVGEGDIGEIMKDNNFKSVDVLSIDFEFHDRESYDGNYNL